MIPLLHQNTPFPPVTQALCEPNGLLAVGGSLAPERLLNAYRHGIFPWFNACDPILWWSPDPRMVLFPEQFKISHSLKKTLRKQIFEVRFNTAFEQVMRCCAAPREIRSDSGHLIQTGTWIHEEMIAAYTTLHRMGYAHSVESWKNGELVGGLYGVNLGRMFFGESMFSRHNDASKMALAYLVSQFHSSHSVLLKPNSNPALSGCGGLIDCQMATPHLESLGAKQIPRREFILHLQELIHYPALNLTAS